MDKKCMDINFETMIRKKDLFFRSLFLFLLVVQYETLLFLTFNFD